MNKPKLKKGEIYAGISLHQGKPCHLVMLPGHAILNHAAATSWAKERGGELPNRVDALVICENPKTRKAIGSNGWMWTSQTYVHYDAYAWIQSFSHGVQYDGRKDFNYRARAVRRVPLERP